jgi:23S rRNA maturation mini-RNase III
MIGYSRIQPTLQSSHEPSYNQSKKQAQILHSLCPWLRETEKQQVATPSLAPQKPRLTHNLL